LYYTKKKHIEATYIYLVRQSITNKIDDNIDHYILILTTLVYNTREFLIRNNIIDFYLKFIIKISTAQCFKYY